MEQFDKYYKSLTVGVTTEVGLLLTDVLQSSSISASASVSFFQSILETRRLLYFRDTRSNVVEATIQHIYNLLENSLLVTLFFNESDVSLVSVIAYWQ